MSATVRVGDPDPTADVWAQCLAQAPEGYLCTAEVGHVGPHIAADEARVVAVWDPGDTR